MSGFLIHPMCPILEDYGSVRLEPFIESFDAMLMQIGGQQLTHELLTTIMAEVTGIVNSRPISIIPSDIEEPQPLTPAMLLTMMTCPLAAPPCIPENAGRSPILSRPILAPLETRVHSKSPSEDQTEPPRAQYC